jgi:aminopeptidase N
MKCTSVSTQIYEPGVSLELAKNRKTKVSNVTYQLSFSIPERVSAAVTGAAFIEFDYKKDGEDLILDFQNISKHLLSLSVNGKNNAYVFKNEHIIIKDENLVEGKNSVDIKFISGILHLTVMRLICIPYLYRIRHQLFFHVSISQILKQNMT